MSTEQRTGDGRWNENNKFPGITFHRKNGLGFHYDTSKFKFLHIAVKNSGPYT